MSWLISPSELTQEQQHAVQFGMSQNCAIVGSPGAGKTQVLLHRAYYLCNQFDIRPERFRIFVFNKILKDYIKFALCDLQLPEDNVLTFDYWCCLYYKEHINRRLPWNRESQIQTPDFIAIRQAVMRHASIQEGPIFDFVLVDEAIDLSEETFAFLRKISRHVTVCLDSKQKIYDNSSTEAGILFKLGISSRDANLINLPCVCQYNSHLVEAASILISQIDQRRSFYEQSYRSQIENQKPLIYFARNFEDEKQMLYQVISERQAKSERMAILLPQNRQVYGFAQGLKEAGIEVEVPAQRNPNADFQVHDLNSSRPKLMAFHSAKGLTFDTVLMPRLVERSFPRFRQDQIERLLFVGITRATKWCYFSTSLDNPLPILQDKLVPLSSKSIDIMDRNTNTLAMQSEMSIKQEGFDFL